MSIDKCYFIKDEKNLSVVYLESKKVFAKTFHKDGWGAVKLISEATSGNISANISNNGFIFVYSQSPTGDILLHREDGNEWKSTVILKNSSNTLYNLRIRAISENSKTHLLYNVPSDITGGVIRYKIISQELADGKWGTHTAVDTVLDSEPVFDVHKIGENHYAVYYTKRLDSENAFGYREFYLPSKWSEFKVLYKTPYSITDRSIITTKDGIHAIFIIGSPRRQLLYVNKLDSDARPPVVLFDSTTIESSVLFMLGGNIYAVFSDKAYGSFSSVSSDGGRVFSRPARVKNNGAMLKSEYLCDKQLEGIAIGNLYTDANNPGSALYLGDVYREFYPSLKDEPTDASANASLGALKGEIRRSDSSIDVNAMSELLVNKNNKIASLEAKLEDSYQEISDLNRRLAELDALLTGQTGGELNETCGKLRVENAEKAETITHLQNRVIELQTEVASANARADEAFALVKMSRTDSPVESFSIEKEKIEMQFEEYHQQEIEN